MIANILNILSILLMLCVIPTAWLVYKKKLTFFNGVFLGTFLFLVSFACSVYGTYVMYGYSPVDSVINSAFDNVMNAYSSVQGISAEEIQLLNQYIEQAKSMYSILLPSVIVLGNLFWVYVIFMISKGVFAVFRKDVSGFAKFCDLKMPKTALILAIISCLLSVVFKNRQFSYAFFNFSVIIFMVSSVCGLSVIDYAFRKKLRYSVLRALIYIAAMLVLTVITGIGGSLLVFIGMADSVFDFRKTKLKN